MAGAGVRGLVGGAPVARRGRRAVRAAAPDEPPPEHARWGDPRSLHALVAHLERLAGARRDALLEERRALLRTGGRRPTLSGEELAALAAGGVEVGALEALPEDAGAGGLAAARRALAAHLGGAAPSALAAADGRWTPAQVERARAAGFELLFGALRGPTGGPRRDRARRARPARRDRGRPGLRAPAGAPARRAVRLAARRLSRRRVPDRTARGHGGPWRPCWPGRVASGRPGPWGSGFLSRGLRSALGSVWCGRGVRPLTLQAGQADLMAASLSRLWTVHSKAHSPATFARPRRRNRRKPRGSLIWPKTGSTVCFRSR